jgi:hypothetical protein
MLSLVEIVQFNSLVEGTTATKIPVYMISTRENLNYEGIIGQGYGSYSFLNISNLLESCPPEVAIFVHGWGVDENKATEALDRVKMSLEFNKYNTALIGFSWNSNIDWDHAKSMAKENGPSLAQFILDLENKCIVTDVRLIAHSLGARVILSSLASLHNNSLWTGSAFKIASVHLLGAAIDDEEVSKNPQDILRDPTNENTVKSAYGEAIEGEVIKFYNLVNTEDNILQPLPFYESISFYPINLFYQVYPAFENDNALGQSGEQQGIDEVTTPPYYDIESSNQIADIGDADASPDQHLLFCSYFSSDLCEVTIEDYDFGLCIGYVFYHTCNANVGDNHMGYIGFRNSQNPLLLADDGVMDVVVTEWRNH